jgi:hypothetical protein
MNGLIKDKLRAVARLFGEKHTRRLLYLIILGLAAGADFFRLGLVRRTFVFYAIKDGAPLVEDRMFPRAGSAELDLIRYVEELLLGPVSLEAAPLFSRETKLQALLYRDGVVYADFSVSAAWAPPEGGDVFRNLAALREGIRRNFPSVQDVRLFVNGRGLVF